MSSALYGSSATRHFEGSDAIDIRDRITFDFYTGLPHTVNQEIHAALKSCNFSLKMIPRKSSVI